MCIKQLSKTVLNPKAIEWRPMQKQQLPPPLPHRISAPQAAPPPPFNPTPLYYYAHPRPSLITYVNYTQRHPFYYVYDQSYDVAAKSGNEMGKRPEYPHEMGKRPECPPNNDVVFEKGYRSRVFPPRLQRRSFRVTNNTAPFPQPKKEWRPRRSVTADCKIPGDGGAVLSPPCAGGDGRLPNSKKTTVMIKNIPNQLRRDFMLKFLDDYCKEHYLEYDFLYLPMDFRKKDNLGYAFVNFTTAVAALKFKKILQNYKWGLVYDEGRIFTSKKICDITWARIQGKKALIERFHNSSFACDKLEFLPVVLDPPRNGSDPNPSPPVIIGTLHRQALKKID